MATGASALIVGAVWWTAGRAPTGLAITGIRDGELVSATTLRRTPVSVSVDPRSELTGMTLTLNGHRVATTTTEQAVVWHPGDLGDGRYTLTAETTGGRRRSWTIDVDATAPTLSITGPSQPVPVDQPVVVTGRVERGTPKLSVAGASQVVVSGDRFEARFTVPPIGPVEVVASDHVGNRTVVSTAVHVEHPRVQAVHVTASVWGDPARRAAIESLITDGRVNALEIDLKDESGEVGYDTAVPLAAELGARRPRYSLAETVTDLHARGVRVIGRIVAFRDPVLAASAWQSGHHDWVIQTPQGEPLDGGYGGFSNYVSPQVVDYNLDLAEEAARAGVDEILWDYVRRPEGAPETMVVPGRDIPTTKAIAAFLEQGLRRLRPLGVLQGASVFGISASRPDTIGQDLTLMAPFVDYVSPMVYPSHWNKGEYGVADPNAMPYEIVKASLADFQAVLTGTGVGITPWLQDFSFGHTYTTTEVADQVRAAAELGISGYLLWNPNSDYHVDALERTGSVPAPATTVTSTTTPSITAASTTTTSSTAASTTTPSITAGSTTVKSETMP